MSGDAIERYAWLRGGRRRAAALMAAGRLTVPQQVRAVTLRVLSVDDVTPDAAEQLANVTTLEERARDALARDRLIVEGCDEYLLLDPPTNAQAVAQVRALTQAVRALARHQSALIRLALAEFDSAD